MPYMRPPARDQSWRWRQKLAHINQWLYSNGSPPTTVPSVTGVASAADIISCGHADGAIAGASASYVLSLPSVFPEMNGRAHYHVPANALSPARGIICHQGHENLYTGGLGGMAETALAAGFHVVSMAMPCWRPNPGDLPDEVEVTITRSNGSTVDVSTHTEIGTHLNASGVEKRNPIRLFFDPVFLAVNLLVSIGCRVYMCGLSGGGFTTHVMPALDQRIRCSYPTAGFMPYDMPFWGTVGADWEQASSRFMFQAATVRELFAMAAWPGRRVYQILNNLDYAFWYDVVGDPSRPNQKTEVDGYVADVQALLAGNTLGTYLLRVDTTTADLEHAISPASAAFIVADILANDP